MWRFGGSFVWGFEGKPKLKPKGSPKKKGRETKGTNSKTTQRWTLDFNEEDNSIPQRNIEPSETTPASHGLPDCSDVVVRWGRVLHVLRVPF